MINPAIHIISATGGEDVEAVRLLWNKYWASFELPSDFQGFSNERDSLPGVYAPPDGRLLLARIDGQPAATAALRRLGESTCEAKRLYVDPSYRGHGVARAILARLVEEARGAGYREMYGDTLPSMEPALRLYNQIGFLEVGPYSPHPTPDAIFLKLIL
jgi:GNAT superfamily N-acetyltransferase